MVIHSSITSIKVFAAILDSFACGNNTMQPGNNSYVGTIKESWTASYSVASIILREP